MDAEDKRSRVYSIVEGPNFHALMNSFAGPSVGRAYTVSFAIKLSGMSTDKKVCFEGKVVGIASRDFDDEMVFGLRVQLLCALQDYNPRNPNVDVFFPHYNTRHRAGLATFSMGAIRSLFPLSRPMPGE